MFQKISDQIQVLKQEQINLNQTISYITTNITQQNSVLLQELQEQINQINNRFVDIDGDLAQPLEIPQIEENNGPQQREQLNVILTEIYSTLNVHTGILNAQDIRLAQLTNQISDLTARKEIVDAVLWPHINVENTEINTINSVFGVYQEDEQNQFRNLNVQNFNALQQKVDQGEVGLDQVEADINEAEAAILDLQADHDEHVQNQYQLEQANQQQANDLLILTQSHQSLTSSHLQLQDSHSQLSDSHLILKASHEDDHAIRLTNLENQYQFLEGGVTSNININDSQAQEILNLQNNVSILTGGIDYSAELSLVQSKCETNTADITNLTARVDFIEPEVTNILTTQNQLNFAVAQNTTDIQNLTSNVDFIESQVSAILASQNQISFAVVQNTTDITNLTARVDFIEPEVTNILTTQNQLNFAVAQNTSDIQNLQTSVQTNTTSIQTLNSQSTTQNTTLQNTIDDVNQNTLLISSLNGEVNGFNSELTLLQNDIDDVRIDLQAAQTSNFIIFDNIQGNDDQLRAGIERANTEIQTIHQEIIVFPFLPNNHEWDIFFGS